MKEGDGVQYDVIVIGGGASGIVAAITAAECGDKVLLLEAGDRIGRKISASGNGRCNLMNRGIPLYYGDPDFAKQVLEHMDANKQTEFWIEHGLFLKEDDRRRTYPTSDLSSSVLEILKAHLKKNQVEIRTGERVSTFTGDREKGFTVQSQQGSYRTKRIIFSCGGKAAKALGGCEDGYQFMKELGHTVTVLKPALTQIATDPVSISGLKGIRQNGVNVRLMRNNDVIHQETGEVLFTEYGISGICVMQCARFAEQGDQLQLNFLPGLGLPGIDECYEALINRKNKLGFMKPQELLNGWLNSKLGYGILKKAGIDMKTESLRDLPDEKLQDVAQTLAGYPMIVTGLNGFENAQVTAGGVVCSDIDPDNMESKLCPGIHCTGETLNVDGDCGGFNLMFAFATGILAGRNRRQNVL